MASNLLLYLTTNCMLESFCRPSRRLGYCCGSVWLINNKNNFCLTKNCHHIILKNTIGNEVQRQILIQYSIEKNDTILITFLFYFAIIKVRFKTGSFADILFAQFNSSCGRYWVHLYVFLLLKKKTTYNGNMFYEPTLTQTDWFSLDMGHRQSSLTHGDFTLAFSSTGIIKYHC